ncbi:Lipogenin [Cricetulus griseus]|uniref:Lipogenin n=1 Tax=Cricetulus griseus TaxID=10029 RepID=A0A061I690_CRIGR|nr:Lipogenin [Cricetulus griseus]
MFKPLTSRRASFSSPDDDECPRLHQKMVVDTHSMELWQEQSSCHFLNKTAKLPVRGAGKMAQRLRALTVLPDVLSSNPGNHMVAHNHLE